MASFSREGVAFHYRTVGTGLPFCFQHGLGGDVEQPLGIYAPPAGVRLMAFDCRAHGRTAPVGPVEGISFSAFADDMAAFLDAVEAPRAVVGGISMGAGVALTFALRFPERTLGLVLSRPAWLDRPNPFNVRVYGEIARLIRERGPVAGLERYRGSEEFQSVLHESPDAAASLAGQFSGPRAAETVVRLERIPPDSPCESLDALRSITAPTLVLASRRDPVHPFEYGEALASAIPHAHFGELTPKSVSREAHASDVQRHLDAFLKASFPNEGQSDA